MPIAPVALTKEQFEYLQQNVTDQIVKIREAGVLAQTGLHYVVLLQVDAPEVDLVSPFALQLSRTESLDDSKYFLGAVTALNNHAITRGTTGTGTLTEKLNAYLENGGNRILVSQIYATLTTETGVTIDPCYIDPGTSGGCAPGITYNPVTWPLWPVLSATNGVAFSFTATALGTAPITFSVTAADQVLLAARGLSWATPTVSGTPTTGSVTFTLTATNAVGSSTKALTIIIA